MRIDIVTIFPPMFRGPLDDSIVKRAQEKQLVKIGISDLRDYTSDKRRTVDDRPYGGGPGMVMMIEPISKALKKLKKENTHVILTSAGGKLFSQQIAQRLATQDHLIFIAGHYEGVDQRVADYLVDEELSIGPYVLTGGELPVMVMVDAIVRLLPGVLGDEASLTEESHKTPGYIEYPQYTRPEVYQEWRVPKELLSGDHKKMEQWRQEQAKQRKQRLIVP